MLSAIGIDFAFASEQKSPPGHAMMSVSSPIFDVASPQLLLLPERMQLVQAHIGQDQILFVRDANLAESVSLGPVGNERPSVPPLRRRERCRSVFNDSTTER